MPVYDKYLLTIIVGRIQKPFLEYLSHYGLRGM